MKIITCPKCKSEVNANAKFCTTCGNLMPKIDNSERDDKSLSIAGFICSLCGFISCGLTSIVGLILSCIGFSKSQKNGKKDGIALAGITISAVTLTLFLLFFMLGLIGDTGSSNPEGNKSDDSNNKTTEISKQIEVADLSAMTSEERQSWCDDNNINCTVEEVYSNTIEINGFIRQSVSPGSQMKEGGNLTIFVSKGKEPNVAQKNAVRKAESYIRVMAFSREGLIRQLEYEGFTNEEAIYGVDHLSVDWDEQAVKKGKEYLRVMAFSKEGLIKQLEYEGFTHEQAVYGAEQNGL